MRNIPLANGSPKLQIPGFYTPPTLKYRVRTHKVKAAMLAASGLEIQPPPTRTPQLFIRRCPKKNLTGFFQSITSLSETGKISAGRCGHRSFAVTRANTRRAVSSSIRLECWRVLPALLLLLFFASKFFGIQYKKFRLKSVNDL